MGESDGYSLLQFLNEASGVMKRILQQPNQAKEQNVYRLIQGHLFEPQSSETSDKFAGRGTFCRKLKQDSTIKADSDTKEAHSEPNDHVTHNTEDREQYLQVNARRNVSATDSPPPGIGFKVSRQEMKRRRNQKWRTHKQFSNYSDNKVEQNSKEEKRKLIQKECEEALSNSMNIINTVHNEDYVDIANMSLQMQVMEESCNLQMTQCYNNQHSRQAFGNPHFQRNWNYHNQQRFSYHMNIKNDWPCTKPRQFIHQNSGRNPSLPSNSGGLIQTDKRAAAVVSPHVHIPESLQIEQLGPVITKTEEISGAESLSGTFSAIPSSNSTGGYIYNLTSGITTQLQDIAPVSPLIQLRAVDCHYEAFDPLLASVVELTSPNNDNLVASEIDQSMTQQENGDYLVALNDSILDDLDWLLDGSSNTNSTAADSSMKLNDNSSRFWSSDQSSGKTDHSEMSCSSTSEGQKLPSFAQTFFTPTKNPTKS
ncbi:hypothetical protein CAPTEDRAFT_197579 [Capitella teleta]|uniref:Uncharacterized protein n=1 Tax=Capitella teleta TaxID=283909 RepID=R7TWD3_CAPTE|nr:hypothetical protein CAPTEDRAFT_197579 [Capitella teleta]|eukprot:ELT98054.1 hypothetical protein CAPTEDRAFT_197579 [Capitella teleta]